MNARWTKYIERSAMRGLPWYLCVPVLVVMTSCDPDDPVEPDPNPPGGGQVYTPTPYTLTYPSYFSPMPIPANNPLTEEGIRLGRFLLYEERLSGDNTQSCASCHGSAVAFTDHGNRFSTGIDGIQGTRNAMALQNLGWETSFFWDGRAATLEEQILMPVMDPIEMHEEWPDALAKLQADPVYPTLFLRAFGTPGITQERTAKAIAQFLRTMVSSNSKYDRMVRGEELFTVEEQFGFELTTYEGGLPPDVPMGQGGADCFHCHPSGGGRFTDGQIRNNGLPLVRSGSRRTHRSAAGPCEVQDTLAAQRFADRALYARRSLPDLGGGDRTLQQRGPCIHHGRSEHEVHHGWVAAISSQEGPIDRLPSYAHGHGIRERSPVPGSRSTDVAVILRRPPRWSRRVPSGGRAICRPELRV